MGRGQRRVLRLAGLGRAIGVARATWLAGMLLRVAGTVAEVRLAFIAGAGRTRAGRTIAPRLVRTLA